MLLVGKNMFLSRLKTNDCDLEQRCLQSEKKILLMVIDLKEFRWLVGRYLVKLNEAKFVGWIDFVRTLHLGLDSVDVADWKETQFLR